jgi:hypothetical protein
VNIAASAFGMRAGSFIGLITGSDGAIHGAATVVLTKTGAATATVTIDGVKSTLKGSFDQFGNLTSVNGLLHLHIDLGGTTASSLGSLALSGTVDAVTGGTTAFLLSGAHTAYASAETPPEAGKYTILLSATGTDSTVPQATGYATMTVGKAGAVTMAGKLADGTAFSTSAVLLGNGTANRCVIFQPLTCASVTPVGAKGLLAGSLFFEKRTDSDLDGTLEWIKPQQTKGAYPAPIDTSLDAAGSIYKAPLKGGSVLPGFGGGSLTFSDSALLLVKTGTLTSANAFLITNSGTDRTKITITASGGLFTGSFVYPGQTAATAFGGVLFQDGTNGEGFFLGPLGSGTVSLTSP